MIKYFGYYGPRIDFAYKYLNCISLNGRMGCIAAYHFKSIFYGNTHMIVYMLMDLFGPRGIRNNFAIVRVRSKCLVNYREDNGWVCSV